MDNQSPFGLDVVKKGNQQGPGVPFKDRLKAFVKGILCRYNLYEWTMIKALFEIPGIAWAPVT